MRRLPRTAVAVACLVLTIAAAAPAAAGSGPPLTGAVPAARRPGPTAPAAQDPVGGPLLGRSGVVVSRRPGSDPLPGIAATAWLLADADTGEVLAAKAPHLRRPPASTLKTLTALTLLPLLDPETVYRARWADAAAEGSRVGIVPGATYTVHDLWLGLFLQSGNDAASALANAAGGWPRSLRRMNAEADRLQAYDTVARNPSGLDAPGQVSSVYDLALIARAGLARDDFAAYARTVSAQFPGRMPSKPNKPRPTFAIMTQNRLLLHGYDGAIGVKTGYTTMAGRTYVGAARRGGRTLVVTLMQITQPTETAAAALLDWGFANADKVDPVGVLVDPVDPDAAATVSTSGSVDAAQDGRAGRRPAAPPVGVPRPPRYRTCRRGPGCCWRPAWWGPS